MDRTRWRISTATCLAFTLIATGVPPVVLGEPSKADAELARIDELLPGELINDPRVLVDLSQNLGGAKTKVIKSSDIPGGGAARAVMIEKAADQAWQISAAINLVRDIARGDVVTVGFYARALPMDDGKVHGRIGIRIQQSVSPWAGFLDKSFEIGPEWQWYETAGVSNVALTGGASAVSLLLGEKAQNLEIGQVMVIKGANAIAAALPEPPVSLPPQVANISGTLINRPQDGPWNFYGTGGRQQQIADRGIYLGKATRVTVSNKDGQPWELEMAIPVNTPLTKGARYLVAIAARTVSADATDGKASVIVRFQSTQPPYYGFAENVLRPSPNWQLLQLRTTATIDIPQNEAVFKLMFAGHQQVLDIGPVYILKLG